MKTKKVVVGTMAAALLSFMASSIPVAFAADDTVQISVGSAKVNPGEEFSVDVSLTIPAAGIQACDFAVEFDSSILSVTSVTVGPITGTGAADNDPSASVVSVFDSDIIDTGAVNLLWSTMLDSQYWLQDDGVFCTITGTVSEDAKAGTKADLKVIPTYRELETEDGETIINTVIGAGYLDGSKTVRYNVSTADGAVEIVGSGVLYGDANDDGELGIADVVKVMMYSSDREANPMTDKELDNADVNNRGDGVFVSDALSIQKKLAQVIDELPESWMS